MMKEEKLKKMKQDLLRELSDLEARVAELYNAENFHYGNAPKIYRLENTIRVIKGKLETIERILAG